MTHDRVKYRRTGFRWVYIEDFAFLVYMLATCGHQTGQGLDRMIVLVSFSIYLATIVPHFFHRFKVNGYLKWLILFYSYDVLSCIWGDPNFVGSYYGKYVQIFGIVLGLSQRIKSISDIRRCIVIFIVALFYMVILLYVKTPHGVWGTQNIGEAIGLNRNGVGLHAAIGFILSLYFVFNSKRRWTMILSIALSIIFLVVAVYSTSRKGFMMVPIGLVGYWWFYKRRTIRKFRSMARTFFGMVLLGVALWVGARYVMGSDLQVATRVDQASRVIVGGEVSNDWSITERQYFIRKAQELYLQNPIVGAGSNGFMAYMNKINYSHVAYCHNNFFEILSTLGIIGFLIFYYMHVKCLYYARPWNKDMQNIRALTTVLWVLLAITVVFGWWWVYFTSVSTNLLFFLAYMTCLVNKALPEYKRKRIK